MYNNPYINMYNPQPSVDRINNQIAELEKMKTQIQQPVQQPTNLTQNFQLAPSNEVAIRYANNIEDIEKAFVIGDTPFFSKDMSVLWIKNAKGDIKSYTLTEIVQKDEKDLLIESLQMQINEMKGVMNNAKSNDEHVNESTSSKKSTNVSTNKSIKTK